MATEAELTERIAFWEFDTEYPELSTSILYYVQLYIRTSGVVDIGYFEEPEYSRTPVKESDTKPGEKYNSILKLFLLAETFKTWVIATGWLFKDDLVVTAAHCVYGRGERVTCVKACIGFTGLETAGSSTSRQRFASRVALPLEWINTETEKHDVVFLQLTSLFQGVAPLRGGESTREMYEMAIDRKINLELTKLNMLSYQGDLQGGFSGSLVIRNSDGAVIGVHIEGGSFNTAVVIGGPYGVKFRAYEEAMQIIGMKDGSASSVEIKDDTRRKWLKYMDLPCNS